GEARSIDEVDEINITFSEPVAPLKKVEKNAILLIQITPHIKGEGYWKSSTTYCYHMEEKLELSKKYQVKFLGYESFMGKTIRSKEWVFTTPRIKISKTKPYYNAKHQTQAQKVIVYFTQEVNPSRLKPFIEVHAGGEEYDFKVRYSTKEERKLLYHYYTNKKYKKRYITIIPSKKYPIASNIVIRFLPGLPSTEGNIGLKRLKKLKFKTYEKFEIKRIDSDFHGDLGLKVTLSNSVFRDEFYNSVSFDPPVKLQKPGHWYSKKIIISGDFKSGITYSLTIHANTRDRFGQKLGKEYKYQIRCLNYSPYFVSPYTRHFVLESYLDKTIPIRARNVFNAEIFYKKLSRSEILNLTKNNQFRPGLMKTNQCDSFTWKPAIAHDKSYIFGFPLNEIGIQDDGYYFISFPQVGYNYTRRTKKVFQLTNIALVAKFSPAQIFILGFNMETGNPVSNLKYEIYTFKKFLKRIVPNKLISISADSDGIAIFNPGDNLLKEAPDLRKAFVFTDPDKAFVWGLKRDMFNMWEYSWKYKIDYNYKPSSYYNYLLPFTDKYLYKPGQTVRFKGILRRVLLGHLIVPEIENVTVEVFSSRNEKIHTAEIGKDDFTDFGSFSGEFNLPQTAPTGYYRIKFTIEFPNDTKFYHTLNFSVQEYKPAKFEVKVMIKQKRLIAGETLLGIINGKYLFGTPMFKANANYTWMLQSTYYSPPNYDGYSFGTHDTYYRHTIERKDFVLDRGGNFEFHKKKFAIPTKNSALLTVHGEVIDKDNNRISNKSSIIVHRGEYYIGIKTSSYFFEVDKPGEISIVTVTPEGELLNNAKVNLKIVQKEWRCFQKKDASGALRWNRKDIITVIFEESLALPDGEIVKGYTFTKPGYYEIILIGKDNLGNTIITTKNFYVTGPGYVSWRINEGRIIDLVTDKKEYKVGEEIKLLIKSPFETSTALITVERENVIWSEVIRMEGNATTVRIPVNEEFAPNVYINVIIMKERKGTEFDENGKDLGKPEFYSGYSQVSIDSSQYKLNITISSDKEHYEPGDNVELEVTVQDAEGFPVESELCVSIVDKGVLSLVGYKLPDPYYFFWKKRPLDVKTVSTLNDVLGRQKYQEKGEDPGGGGDESSFGSVVVRKNFKESTYYTAFLNTDKNGNATVSFKLPDNLTTFKAMIVAEDIKDKFGTADLDILVKKNLILKPDLPYFVRFGDIFSGGVTVTNNSEETLDVSVTVESEDVDRVEDDLDVKMISLEPGETEAVLFKFKAGKSFNPKLTFKAIAGEYTDGLFQEIPFRVPVMFEAVATSGRVENAIENEEIIVPDGTVRSLDNVEITFSPSSMIGVKRNFQVLQEYPHDCLEQRLSKQYTLLGARDFLLDYGLLDMKREELDKRINDLLIKMPNYQKPDGGFSYYPNSNYTSHYLTCYAIEFILMAKEKGYKYDQQMLKRAKNNLRQIANQSIDSRYPYSRNVSLLVQSKAVFLLAKDGEFMKDVINNLYESRNRMPFSGISYLIKALDYKNDLPEYMQQTLVKMMMNKKKVDTTSNYFENDDDNSMRWVHESNVKTTAIVLEALLTVYGIFPDAEKIFKWLALKTKQKRYMSTQEHLRLFMAFEKYYKVFEKDSQNYVAEVLFNNEMKIAETFEGRESGTRTNRFSITEYSPGEKVNISFQKKGQGTLHYMLRVKYYPIDPKEMKAVNRGFKVEKIYKTLDGKIIKNGKFKKGEKYIVELIIETNKDRAFVMLDDPVAAGFKVVNPNFRTSSELDKEKLQLDNRRRNDWGNFYRSEYYFDRVEVFTDYLRRGKHIWKYLVIATNSGEYMIPNTLVHEMYNPEVFGRNDGKIIEIK
ncbi:hypothetical protein KAU33_10540, partial [Candidatus Dependentiae bacterium]|nr:hypothetical protein [Candidatus Dependentiae bacterium]